MQNNWSYGSVRVLLLQQSFFKISELQKAHEQCPSGRNRQSQSVRFEWKWKTFVAVEDERIEKYHRKMFSIRTDSGEFNAAQILFELVLIFYRSFSENSGRHRQISKGNRKVNSMRNLFETTNVTVGIDDAHASAQCQTIGNFSVSILCWNVQEHVIVQRTRKSAHGKWQIFLPALPKRIWKIFVGSKAHSVEPFDDAICVPRMRQGFQVAVQTERAQSQAFGRAPVSVRRLRQTIQAKR